MVATRLMNLNPVTRRLRNIRVLKPTYMGPEMGPELLVHGSGAYLPILCDLHKIIYMQMYNYI